MPRKTFLQLLFFQFLIWLGIMLMLRLVFFADNPDWVYTRDHNVIGIELARFGGQKLIVLNVLWLIFDHAWKYLPLLLKKASWFVPAMIGAYLIFGWYSEYRVLYEVFPIIILVLAYALILSGGKRCTT